MQRLEQKKPITLLIRLLLDSFATLSIRARFSDGQASGNFIVDLVKGAVPPEGFIEAKVERSKTSFSLERKTRHLPMVAQITGLTEENSWALAWIRAMHQVCSMVQESLYFLLRLQLESGIRFPYQLKLPRNGSGNFSLTLLRWTRTRQNTLCCWERTAAKQQY